MPDRDFLDKDYYALLGVSEDATRHEINSAYRNLARRLHPDAGSADPAAEERFKQVSAAHAVLSDRDKRSEYDRRRGPAARDAARRIRVRVDEDGFRDVFDRGGAARRRPDRASARRRGRDVKTSITLSFADALRGLTTSLRVPGREVRARIPGGVRDGARVLLRGKGEAGTGGAPAGDLYVTVHVRPHELFGRRGDDLTVAVPVAFTEAALGAEIAIPTLDGEDVTVRIPAGTSSGETLRVPGRGAPTPQGGRGDLLVTVEVVVPRRLSRKQRTLLQELAAAESGGVRDHLRSESPER